MHRLEEDAFLESEWDWAEEAQPSEHLPDYLEWFKDVEAETADLLTFSCSQQARLRVRFSEQFVERPKVVLRQFQRGGTVVVFDVLQGLFALEIHMLILAVEAPTTPILAEGAYG